MQDYDLITRKVTREIAKMERARRDVQQVTGMAVDGCTSSGEIYLSGLRQLGVDTTDLEQHGSNAIRAAFEIAKTRGRPKARVAMDAGTIARRREMFGANAERLGR